MASSDDLAGRLSDLARSLRYEGSVDETLQAIVEAAVGTVPGAQYAALSVVEQRRAIYTRAGTAPLVFEVDEVQYDTGEGPCLSAIYDQQTVLRWRCRALTGRNTSTRRSPHGT